MKLLRLRRLALLLLLLAGHRWSQSTNTDKFIRMQFILGLSLDTGSVQK
jgi:hypothetical protein